MIYFSEMKRLLLSISIVLTSVLAYGQAEFPISQETGKIEYSKVISVPETGKGELFERAKLWLAAKIVSAKAAQEYSNPETGRIFSKTSVRIYDEVSGMHRELGRTDFTIEINCKDNRYRVILTDFEHSFDNGSPSPVDLRKEKSRPIMKGWWLAIKRETKSEILGVIESLEKGMVTEADDDW